MELALHCDGEEPLILRVPTLWDAVNEQWLGFVQTPKKLKLITGKGKDSFELQNSFNKEISDVFAKGGELADDLYSMFKPKSHWK